MTNDQERRAFERTTELFAIREFRPLTPLERLEFNDLHAALFRSVADREIEEARRKRAPLILTARHDGTVH